MTYWASGLVAALAFAVAAPVEAANEGVVLQPAPVVVQQPAPVVVQEPAPVVVHQPVAMPALTVDAACCGALSHLPPGKHRVTFIHPYTCCPVDVCFCLPCGCYDVQCGKGLFAKKIRFDIPGHFNDVVIKFRKNGSVTVND